MTDSQRIQSPTSAWMLAVLALIWTGMVIGVSVLATPIKFSAPSLSLPVALDVGRVTFQFFGRVEWGLTGLLVLAGFAAGLRSLWLPVGLVVALVLAQAVWLQPALDARALAVIAGEPLPPSWHHSGYVVAEGVKLLALLIVGLGALRGGTRVQQRGLGIFDS